MTGWFLQPLSLVPLDSSPSRERKLSHRLQWQFWNSGFDERLSIGEFQISLNICGRMFWLAGFLGFIVITEVLRKRWKLPILIQRKSTWEVVERRWEIIYIELKVWASRIKWWRAEVLSCKKIEKSCERSKKITGLSFLLYDKVMKFYKRASEYWISDLLKCITIFYKSIKFL